MNFPEIGPAHAPEIDISKYTVYYILDEFIRNSHPGKLKFQKNFWMSFPGFANKG